MKIISFVVVALMVFLAFGIQVQASGNGDHACSDGTDNDGDGYADSRDGGCSNDTDDDESGEGTHECNDHGDNDHDGDSDSEDGGCSSSDDDDENNDEGNNNSIPEFPTIALPVAATLGLMYFFVRRKGE